MSLNKSTMFATGVRKLSRGSIDPTAEGTHVWRACLVKKSFANTTLTDARRDTYNDLDDIPADDISLGTVGGTMTAFPTVSQDVVINAGSDHVGFGTVETTIVFPTVASGVSCRGIVIYRSAATGAASDLICYNHFSAEVTAQNADVTVNVAAEGLFKASY